MLVKPEGPLEDIKMAVFPHPRKAKHLNFSTYIYILYYQSYYQSSICLLVPKTVANFPDI